MVNFPVKILAVFGLVGGEDSPKLGVARRLLALCTSRRYVGCGSVSLVLLTYPRSRLFSHPKALLTVDILWFLVNPNLEADIREFC